MHPMDDRDRPCARMRAPNDGVSVGGPGTALRAIGGPSVIDLADHGARIEGRGAAERPARSPHLVAVIHVAHDRCTWGMIGPLRTVQRESTPGRPSHPTALD